MNSRIAVMAGVGIFVLAGAAYAEPIKYIPSGALAQLCHSNNGTFLPPTADSPVYACYKKDGGLIVCGGIGKWAKTCEGGTFIKKRDIRKRLKGRQ